MGVCCVFGCKNRTDRNRKKEGVGFHRFPKDENLKKQWVHAIRRDRWKPTEHSLVCTEHFSDNHVNRTYPSGPKLRESAVPSVFQTFPEHLKKVVKLRKPPRQRTIDVPESNSECCIVPNKEENHIVSNKKETHNVPNEKESHIVPNEKESHIAPNEKETHNVPNEKGSHIVPNEKESHIVPNKKETHNVPNEKGSHIVLNEKESHIVPNKEDSHTVPSDNESQNVPGISFGNENISDCGPKPAAEPPYKDMTVGVDDIDTIRLKTENKQLCWKVNRLSSRIDEKSRTIKSMRKKIHRLEDRVHSLTALVNDIDTVRLETVNKQLCSKVNHLSSRLEEKSHTIKNMRKKNLRLVGRVNSLTALVNLLKSKNPGSKIFSKSRAAKIVKEILPPEGTTGSSVEDASPMSPLLTEAEKLVEELATVHQTLSPCPEGEFPLVFDGIVEEGSCLGAEFVTVRHELPPCPEGEVHLVFDGIVEEGSCSVAAEIVEESLNVRRASPPGNYGHSAVVPTRT